MPNTKNEIGTVVFIGGSLRSGSISQDIIEDMARECSTLGVGVASYHLSDFRLDLFDPVCTYEDVEPVQSFLRSLREAVAVVWSVPAYHGGMSGAFKNVIDYIDLLGKPPQNFLQGKTIFIVTVGAGAIAPVTTARMLVDVAHALRATVHPTVVPVRVDIKDTSATWRKAEYKGQLSNIVRTASALTLRQSLSARD